MNVATPFLERSRHYLAVEYPMKIGRCLDVLPGDALWRRTDAGSNSIGNLLLHLSGNIRQWIVSGVGGAPDHRRRSAEFEAREEQEGKEGAGSADAATLFAGLRQTLDEADAVIAALTPDRLLERLIIQGRELTVFDAVYHVVEHCSMHTGQIILLTKAAAPGRIQFYEDAGGLAIPRQ